jgi:DNA (cytosine-5)-methyltransferase 1
MRIGSLFSGGGGGDLGFRNAGHEIVFGCEIDPKARSVFRFHHPNVPIYNDVKEVTHERLESDGIAFPELIMGGSPCQDLSIAGNRAGLGGERSGLFHEQCRIADEFSSPWVCWENVAGAFSSNKGLDFAAVLGGLTGYTPTVPNKGWRTGGICVGPKRIAVWRVLDAQNFGVPQRRRRVFVVAGPRTLARRVVQVLFESESVFRDTPKSRKTGTEVSASIAESVGTDSRGGLTDISQTIQHKYPRNDLETDSFILQTWAGSAQQENIAAPLLHGFGGPRTTDIDGGTWVVHNDNAQSLHENQRGEINLSDIAHCLGLGGGKPGQGYSAVQIGSIVRRLTPLECERLMGWPDNYTANGIDDQGTPVDLATTNRYRICGNGIVSTVTEWIGNRLP